VLSRSGKNMHRQLIGVRHIGGHELNSALHQRGNESQIAGQAVKLGNDKLGLQLLTGCERSVELRAIGMLAALDLGELLNQRPPPAIEERIDCFAL
jgi:hypothetical protein